MAPQRAKLSCSFVQDVIQRSIVEKLITSATEPLRALADVEPKSSQVADLRFEQRSFRRAQTLSDVKQVLFDDDLFCCNTGTLNFGITAFSQ